MVDKVAIVNQAIGLLNANRIEAFTDGTAEADLATDFYESLRDAVLEEADWSFAIQVLNISADNTPPISTKWSARYLIPNETVRVITVNGNELGAAWVREGQYILTNYGKCEARVLSQITNPNYFSPMFVQALVYRIAWAWALPVTRSHKLAAEFEKAYIVLVNNATNSDSMQGTPENIGQGRLIEARRGGNRGIAGPTV